MMDDTGSETDGQEASTQRLERQREEFAAMFFALREDAAHWIPGSREDDSLFARRAFVRATFAFVEGTSYSMKRLALAMHEAGDVVFKDADLAVLREEAYELDNSGKAKTRRMKVRTLDNLKFAFESFARAHQVDDPPRTDGAGWRFLEMALAIRHRLSHPKASRDLEVSDDEIEIVNQAGKMVQDAVTELLTKVAVVTRARMLELAHQSIFINRPTS